MSLCKILYWFDNELDNLVENFRKKYDEYVSTDLILEMISTTLGDNSELLLLLLWSNYECIEYTS